MILTILPNEIKSRLMPIIVDKNCEYSNDFAHANRKLIRNPLTSVKCFYVQFSEFRRDTI